MRWRGIVAGLICALFAAAVHAQTETTYNPLTTYIENAPAWVAPFLSTDDVPLVRGGVLYKMPGTLLGSTFTGDAVDGTGLVTTAGSTTITGVTLSASDAGKLFWAPGLGAGGASFKTTITAALKFAAAPTSASPATWFADDRNDTTDISPVGPSYVTGNGEGFVAGEVVTLAGGTCSVATQLTVDMTTVVSAVINNAGSGGIAGQYLVRLGSAGSGSAGTQGQLLVTVAAGSIASIDAINWGGMYFTNPLDLAAEPVSPLFLTDAGLVDATVTIKMGWYRRHISRPGICTAAPTSPVSMASSSGSGTAATFAVPYTQTGAYTIGTDNTATLVSEMARTDSPELIFGVGTHLITCLEYPAASSVILSGAGKTKTAIRVEPDCVLPSSTAPGGHGTIFFWAPNNTRAGAKNLRLDMNGTLADPGFSTAIQIRGTSNVVLDNVEIIDMGVAGSSRISAVQLNAVGLDITSWRMLWSKFALRRPTPMQTHGLNISLTGGGTATRGFVIGNKAVYTNITGEYGQSYYAFNEVSGQGYGSGISTSGQTGPFAWLTGNLYVANEVHDTQTTPGEDGSSHHCYEALGTGAVGIGLKGWNCGGGGIWNYNTNVTLNGGAFFNNSRKFDGIQKAFIATGNLANGNPSRDGSGFRVLGVSIYDDTGRTDQVCYGEYAVDGTLTGNVIGGGTNCGSTMGLIGVGGILDEERTGGLVNGTNFSIPRLLRRTATVTNPLAAFSWTNIDIDSARFWRITCSGLKPAAADAFIFEVGEGATPTWMASGYRYGGQVNYSNTDTVAPLRAAPGTAIPVGINNYGPAGSNVLEILFGDLAIDTANNFKPFNLRASYRDDSFNHDNVTVAGAYAGDSNKVTSLRGRFLTQNAIGGSCTLSSQ